MSGTVKHPIAAIEAEEDNMAAKKEPTTMQLAMCFCGIFAFYFIYGFLQESITKGKYGEEGDKFNFTLALLFCQCIINAAFAQIMIITTNPPQDTSPQSMYAAMSLCYIGAMICSFYSLQYIAYPTQVLGKSIKPIPVMIMGVLFAGKKYPLRKYMFVLMIVIGVALFTYKDEQGRSAEDDHTFGFGGLYLLASLMMDGMTGGIQDRIRAEYTTQTHRMMFFLNAWSLTYLAVALVLTGEGLTFISFVMQYPWVIVNISVFSCCSAVGQYFIFLTVTTFGPLMCSIFTTTRKFFTILGSVLIFGHVMVGRQWLGTILVFIGLVLDNLYGKEQKKDKKEA